MAVSEVRLTGSYCPNKYPCTKLHWCVNFLVRSLLPHGISRVEVGQCDLDSQFWWRLSARLIVFMHSPGLVDGYFHKVGYRHE